jgi:hypothetical protein
MTSKLSLFKGALLNIGDRSLSALTDNVEPRYALDDAYDEGVALCLEAGYWNHAMRVVQVDSSASVTPAFGYQYAFTKPTDWVRTYQASPSETLVPLLDQGQLNDEAGYWYANIDPLFVKYVSNDVAYGMDLSKWPQSFTSYVEWHLADKIAKRVTGKVLSDADKLEVRRAKRNAMSKDAMNEGAIFPPMGSWARARAGFFGPRSPINGTGRGL